MYLDRKPLKTVKKDIMSFDCKIHPLIFQGKNTKYYFKSQHFFLKIKTNLTVFIGVVCSNYTQCWGYLRPVVTKICGRKVQSKMVTIPWENSVQKFRKKNSQMVSFHDSGFRILISIPTTKVLKPLTFYRYIYITFIFQKKQTSIHLNVVA